MQRIGLWATIWWGVSGLYVVLLFWVGRSDYVTISERAGSGSAISNWQSAISSAYSDSSVLPALLALIVIVWLIGGWVWLRELKRQKISYKAAFKDLFLTIR